MLLALVVSLASFLSAQPRAVPDGRAALPTIRYAVRIDSGRLDVIDVAVTIANAPPSFRLAMKVHAEYDAHYWRYLDGARIDGAAGAAIARADSTLWRVTLPGGIGTVHYTVHVQPPAAERRAWMTTTRPDGALLNPPDIFLYSPDFPNAPAVVSLDVPRSWKFATALAGAKLAALSASDAVTLLDSPILLGALREWMFREGGTTYHVAYWPLPAASPFDTVAFVDALHGVARAALEVFHAAPSTTYHYLIQDGAGDALEHRASVTIGVPSVALAENPRSHLQEISHEFFHSWNLVVIRPAGYNDLSYQAPVRTDGLWLGEGVTMHYADILPRRAGFGSVLPRLEHLTRIYQHYFASAAMRRVSPERASLAFGDALGSNPDATGGYYLQGELLGEVLDALVRDSTSERRGLDDVMRALFERSLPREAAGLTSRDVEETANVVCSCHLARFFTDEVRGTGPIDITPVLARIGLRAQADSGNVRFVDLPTVTPAQAKRREAWLVGR